MWPFIVVGLIVIVVVVMFFESHYREDSFVACFGSIVLLFLGNFFGFILSLLISQATTGAMPDYSNGVRIGYVTKISRKGVFWRTWEVEFQMGTGEQAALQPPHHFSLVDDDLAKELRDRIGNKALITYREWLIMPYSIGSSGSEIMSVQWQ